MYGDIRLNFMVTLKSIPTSEGSERVYYRMTFEIYQNSRPFSKKKLSQSINRNILTSRANKIESFQSNHHTNVNEKLSEIKASSSYTFLMN